MQGHLTADASTSALRAASVAIARTLSIVGHPFVVLRCSNMVNTKKVGSINRLVALSLALVWACAGVAGLTVAFTRESWVAAIAGVFALWYAILWARVGIQARLLTWSEIGAPWRAR